MAEDYAPAIAPDDEEERQRLLANGGYTAPAPAAPPPASIASAPTSPDLVPPAPTIPRIAEPKEPKWSDYAPPERHGWGKFGSIIATLTPTSNEIVNARPLRTAERNYKAATGEYEKGEAERKETSEEALRSAQAGEAQARAESLRNPPEKTGTTPEAQTLHDLMTGENGQPRLNPETKKPYSYLEAYQATKQAAQDVKPEPVAPAHVTYDAGIPVSVTGADKKTYDINDPNLPAELKPLVQSATRAHSQHIKEETDRQARAMAQQEKMFNARQEALTNTTKTMVEAAPKVLALAERLNSLIDQQVQTLGPAASRWQEFMAGRVGSPNPEFTKLRTDAGLLQTLLMRMHVGSRGGEYIMKHFQDLLDTGRQSPENMKAALEEITQYAHDVQSEGGKGEFGNNRQKPPQFTVPPGAPAAPKEDGHKLKANGQVIAVSKGGQWVAPQ